jgi:DNA-directed RNA polymerase subunit omega
MARVTVEDSLKEAKNRFALVILAAQRTRQLLKGSKPRLENVDNKQVVLALREVAATKVRYARPELLISIEEEERKFIGEETGFIGEDEDTE